MNKLVSKHPVQRFKQGRKIVKAQWGLRTRKDGVVVNRAGVPVYNINGGYIPPTMTQDISYQREFPTDVQILPGLYLEKGTNYVYASRPESKDGRAGYARISSGSEPPANGTYYETKDASGKVIERGRYFGGKKHPLPIGPSSSNKKQNNSQLSSEESSKPVSVEKRQSTHNRQIFSRKSNNSPKFYGQTVGGKVLARGSNFNGLINDSQKQALLNAGFKNEDFNDVSSFQNALNNFFSKDGKGSVKVDNMWGNQTQKAFDLALSKAAELQSLKSPEIFKRSEIFKRPELSTISKNELPTINSKIRTGNYNRSQIRDLIRKVGFNPYTYTGAQRKALRLYLNGLSDDTSLLDGTDLARFTLPFRKKGGQLISRNPIQRFKLRTKI